ncbi:molybdopterin molybdotransferase MoeA [Aminivibrio sp.]|uniref:molybdopterin molybdotransferase MoeA n=1 Tax=Aminivibrio sp. TaxID=1872489 RepID=UPI001A3BAECC|nr:molybdopterin molybdotransferase MoeA [Aminivibrio sp.]MBL3538912.1 molybdopterin molybdotransferase MoeA [Aminivibrio sp.]
MAGFVEALTPRETALDHVSAVLRFPWKGEEVPVPVESCSGRISRPLIADENFPPFPRSTRDGYAVVSADCLGAAPGSPAYLTLAGEIPMGSAPSLSIRRGECALIHTGGILPDGADAVVMVEDTENAGNWIEVKKAVQRAENTVQAGEEFSVGDTLLKAGQKLDFRTAGLLAMAGVREAATARLTVGIISTGDEIAPPETVTLPAGKVRDVNASMLSALLIGEGHSVRNYGIAEDTRDALAAFVREALRECDVVAISGGSSVSMRDHCSSILEDLPPPGLLVRGILMSPGKPTLIAGTEDNRKLVLGLPGHPFSCFISAYTVLIPLLNALLLGKPAGPWKRVLVPVQEPVFGHTGIEEFIPCVLRNGRAFPFPVKSSFSKALAEADGLFRLSASHETIRQGEEAEIWLW